VSVYFYFLLNVLEKSNKKFYNIHCFVYCNNKNKKHTILLNNNINVKLSNFRPADGKLILIKGTNVIPTSKRICILYNTHLYESTEV